MGNLINGPKIYTVNIFFQIICSFKKYKLKDQFDTKKYLVNLFLRIFASFKSQASGIKLHQAQSIS